MVSKLEQIEAREGRPMREILIDLYAKHGSQTRVAKALGVTQGTVSLWLVRFGLEQFTVLVPMETSRAAASVPDDQARLPGL